MAQSSCIIDRILSFSKVSAVSRRQLYNSVSWSFKKTPGLFHTICRSCPLITERFAFILVFNLSTLLASFHFALWTQALDPIYQLTSSSISSYRCVKYRHQLKWTFETVQHHIVYNYFQKTCTMAFKAHDISSNLTYKPGKKTKRNYYNIMIKTSG